MSWLLRFHIIHHKERKIHFGYSIIYVASVPETLAFYDKAFGLQTGFLHESELYGELKTGATTLALTAYKPEEKDKNLNFISDINSPF